MRSPIGAVLVFGFACVSAACGRAGAAVQIGVGAAGALVVAPDETHVAFLRNPQTVEAGCMNRGAQLTTGTLVVAGPVAGERMVARGVQAQSIFFSSDSRGLTFLSDVDTCGVGKLGTADVDGANVRWVRESVSYSQRVGVTVFFRAKNEESVLAAAIAGAGKAVSLGMGSGFGDPASASNATGTAVAYLHYGWTSSQDATATSLVLVGLPSGKSQTLVDGEKDQVGNYLWSVRGNWLAFWHGPVAAQERASLTLVAADGSRRIDIASHASGHAVFSPDDAWLAFTELEASGGKRLATYALADQRTVALGVLPEGDLSLAFSDDGASVLAAVDTPTSVGGSIYAATTAVSGSLRYLVDRVGPLSDVASAGGYVAVPTGNGTVAVYPVSGGDPVIVPGNEPKFEPGVPQPHLLSRQLGPSRVTIAANDGSAATTQVAPDFLSFAMWLGSTAVYGITPASSELVTISALTDAGSVTTLLADQIEAYAWAPIAAPTRLFYSREVASPGGPAGVFYVDLPR